MDFLFEEGFEYSFIEIVVQPTRAIFPAPAPWGSAIE